MGDGRVEFVQPGAGPLNLAFPRADYRPLSQVAERFGVGPAVGVLDTAQNHQMDAFYVAPRAHLTHIPDSLRYLLARIPSAPNFLTMQAHLGDKHNLHFLVIDGDPNLLGRAHAGSEVFRKPVIRSYDTRDLTDPTLDQVIVLRDKRGRAIGSLAAIREEGEQGRPMRLVPHTEALRHVGASVLTARSDNQLSHLYEQAEKVLGPGTEFAKHTGRPIGIERFLVLENGLRAVELLEKYKRDPDALEAIYEICRTQGMPPPYNRIVSVTDSLLGFCDTREELLKAAEIVRTDLTRAFDLCKTFEALCHETVTAGDQSKFMFEKPLAHRVFQLGRDLIKTALFNKNHPDFRQEYLDASHAALFDTLNDLHAINLPDQLAKEQEVHKGLSDYAVAHATDTAKLSLIAPIVERYFYLKLERYIPGEFARARAFFYKTLGESLYANASETTGDDELQLAMLTDVFRQLHRLGYWKKGNILEDAGSGDGKRILLPFLGSDVMEEAPPGKVYAVDGDAYPQPSHGLWESVQGQFENADYPLIHGRRIGRREIVSIDAITGMWSPPNDLEGPDQQRMLDNFSRCLKKRKGNKTGGVLILEVPMGYVEEMVAYADAHSLRDMGRVEVAFPLGEGREISKPFEIMMPHNIILRARQAGFRPLNLPPGEGVIQTPAFYQTRKGKNRAILVFERVGDPEPTSDLAATLEDHQTFAASARHRSRS